MGITKSERIRHVVTKLAARYGNDDTDVTRLQAELEAIESYEFCYPDLFARRPKCLDARTPARRAYFNSALRSGPI
ncbi:MAG: hypothetical protein K9K38_05080 [Rhodoferax sp.]|nr:hypothetical protein [Rhodoferax sp.]